MKETLAKGGKIEKNMKKQSILNLVNSILLLCTLLFSVISFAWYSPNKDVGTPLSFGAGGTGSLILTQFALTDPTLQTGNKSTIVKAPTLQYSDVEGGIVKPYLGRNSFPITNGDFGSTDESTGTLNTVLEFGTIDDLGYLKESNAIYYCVTVPYDLGTSVEVNLAYTLDHLKDYPYNLYHYVKDADTQEDVLEKFGADTHEAAIKAESDQDSADRYIAFEAVKSYYSPDSITAEQVLTMFPRHDDETATNRPTKHSVVALVDETTTDADGNVVVTGKKEGDYEGSAHEVTMSALDGSTVPDSPDEYYIYIKIYPDLDSYHALAELMMDHMPFYTAFDLRLYIGVHK